MVVSLAALFVALSFTQATSFPPEHSAITTYRPIRATIKRAINEMRTPKPVVQAQPDLRVFLKQQSAPAHEVSRALASYDSVQLSIEESAFPAVGVPVYQPRDQLDANDFHFSMSYKFEF